MTNGTTATSLAASDCRFLIARGAGSAVVVHAGERLNAERIAQQVGVDGAVAVITDRRALGAMSRTPQHVADALAGAGLRVDATYAIVGPVRQPRAFVSLRSTNPMLWYLDTISRVHTANTRAMEAVVRRAASMGAGALSAICPAHVVVAAGNRATRQPAALDGAPGVAERLNEMVLMVQGGDRVVALAFADGDIGPRVAVKVPRGAALSGRTANDHAVLTRLHSQLPPALAAGIPRPLGAARAGSVTVATETVVRGTTLLRRAGSARFRTAEKLDDLRRATGWLSDFHAATRTGGGASPVDMLDAAAIRYREMLGVHEAERILFERAAAHARSFTASIPFVLQHRDFNPWNILRDGDAIGVVDWEGAREGTALIDLIQFCTNWYDAVHGATSERAKLAHYGKLFFSSEPDDAAAGAREAVRTYLDRLGISAEVVPLAILVSWLELAASREEQRQAHAAIGDARADNRAVPFIASLAASPDLLFDPGWIRHMSPTS